MLNALNTLEEQVGLELTPQSFFIRGEQPGLAVASRATLKLSYQKPNFLDYLCKEMGWNRADAISVSGGGITGKLDWQGKLLASPMRSEQVLDHEGWDYILKHYISVGGYMLIKDGSELQKTLLSACPKVPDAAGYLSRFQAALIPEGWFPSVTVTAKTPSIEGIALGSDGASWGWNINHPLWKEVKKAYQEVTLQFTALGKTVDAEGRRFLAKGILVPFDGSPGEAPVYIAPNAVKGAMKGLVKDGDQYEVFLGYMRADDEAKTQKLGYQWLENVPVTERSILIAQDAAKKAVRQLVKTSPISVAKKLGGDNPDIAVLANLAEFLGVSPLAIPNLRELVLAKLSEKLWDSFAGIGMQGQVYTLIMDSRLKPGECVYRGEIGVESVVVRSPQVHWQGCRVIRNVAPLAGHSVFENKVIKNVIFLSLEDTAALNGDDDGDTVALFSQANVVELGKIAQAKIGNTAWSFEPSSSSVKEKFDGPTGGQAFEDARVKLHKASQGPVGLAANARSFWLGFSGNQLVTSGKSYALAATVLEQTCVDDLKKMTKVSSVERLATLGEWQEHGNQKLAPKPVNSSGLTSHEAVAELLEIQSEELSKAQKFFKSRKVNPIAWKLQTTKDGKKLSGKVAPDNFLSLKAKDGGWSTRLKCRHSLLHWAHDAAQEEWTKSPGEWDLDVKIISASESLTMILPDMTPDKPSQRLLNEMFEMVADKNRRLARYYTEMASWDGDDDGGKGAIEAVKKFKNWGRKLTAEETMSLAYWASEHQGACEQDCFMLLGLSGSEFALRLEIDPSECKVLTAATATLVTEAFVEAIGCHPSELPTQAIELFDVAHPLSIEHAKQSIEGISLIDCPDCSMRLKQAIAEASRGHSPQIKEVEALASKIPVDFKFYQVEEVDGESGIRTYSNAECRKAFGKEVKLKWMPNWSQPIIRFEK